MNKLGFIKDALILFAITLVSGAALGGVYEITKDPIVAAEMAAKAEAYRTVLPDAAEFKDDLGDKLEAANSEVAGLGYGNVTVDEAVTGVDASGAAVGYVVTATSKDGYGGAITVSVGFQKDGTVNNIEFLALSETPSLGMNASQPEWKGQYTGKNVDSFTVTKNGAAADNEIDAISGATITSNAVTGAVNGAVYFVKNCLAQ